MRAVLPYAFAVAAQTIVVIAGGIDLSVASMMALTSVTAASMMDGASEEYALFVVPFVLAMGLVLGAINGMLIVVTRVPDIVVTLATLFVLQGAALLVLDAPGGAVAEWLKATDRRHRLHPGRAGGHHCLDPEGAGAPGRLPRHRLDTAQALDGSACRSTPSAAASSPPFAAACRSRAPGSSPMRWRGFSPPWAGWR